MVEKVIAEIPFFNYKNSITQHCIYRLIVVSYVNKEFDVS